MEDRRRVIRRQAGCFWKLHPARARRLILRQLAAQKKQGVFDALSYTHVLDVRIGSSTKPVRLVGAPCKAE